MAPEYSLVERSIRRSPSTSVSSNFESNKNAAARRIQGGGIWSAWACPLAYSGIRGSLRFRESEPQFHWGRAIVAGGLAGTISGLAFSGWEYTGGVSAAAERPTGVPVPRQAVTLQLSDSPSYGRNFWNSLSIRRPGLWLKHGLGPRIRDFLVVFSGHSPVFFPLLGRVPDRLVGRSGQRVYSVRWSDTLSMDSFWEQPTHFWIRIWVRMFIQSDPLNPRARKDLVCIFYAP